MLSEHLKNERFQRLNSAWKYLTPWQRNIIFFRIMLAAFPRKSIEMLNRHITRRQLKLTRYLYNAHWAGY